MRNSTAQSSPRFAHGSSKATTRCTFFWIVERLAEGERRKALKGAFNPKCEDRECVAVPVGGLSRDSIASTFTVIVPIRTNAVAVKKGEELFLENATRKEPKRKDGPWTTDVAKANQAPKVNAKAKTAASSLEVATEIRAAVAAK